MKLTRITSNKKYIPEIDGLRFVAIFLVIIYHLCSNILEMFDIKKSIHDVVYTINYKCHFGELGVLLFFVISGFILGLPFIKAYTNKEIFNLKSYFYRRLTRLEPPYIIIMTLMAIVFVVVKHFEVGEVLKHYLASLFYTHFLFYPGQLPLVNGVAWSLEVEIQFYILTPLLCKLFLLKKDTRRILLTALICLFALLHEFNVDFKYFILLKYIHYFFIGYLLADFYLYKQNKIKLEKVNNFFAFILFALVLVPDVLGIGPFYIIYKVAIIFLLYYLVIEHKKLNFFFGNKVIATIGGMCYTIYLIHIPVIGFVNTFFKKFNLTTGSANLILYIVISFLAVGLCSFIYFVLIERPCMDPNWVTNLKNKFVKKDNAVG